FPFQQRLHLLSKNKLDESANGSLLSHLLLLQTRLPSSYKIVLYVLVILFQLPSFLLLFLNPNPHWKYFLILFICNSLTYECKNNLISLKITSFLCLFFLSFIFMYSFLFDILYLI